MHRLTEEADVRVLDREAGSAGKDLDDGDSLADLQDPPSAKSSLRVYNLDYLVVADAVDSFDDDDGAFNAGRSQDLLASGLYDLHHE
jgi:hypothetical protein